MVSLGPRWLLKTQFFGKKANFPVKKSFWPIFSRIFECEKPRGQKQRSKGYSGIQYGSYQTVFWTEGVDGNKIFKKIAVFTGTIDFGPFFVVLSNVKNLKKQYTRVRKLL